jgi:hypothetical protein
MKLKLARYLLIVLALYFINSKVDAQTTIIGNSGERAFLHTDRNIYIAGENLFFKLYILDENSYKLSEISKIAYLTLRSRANNSIAQIRLKVEDGISYGSLFLPDTLSSGPYQLIVYTNWMRNSGEESFFKKEIFIANRFDKELSTLSFSLILQTEVMIVSNKRAGEIYH